MGQRAARYGFGTSVRRDPKSREVAATEPAPGSYNLSPRMGCEGPKFSVRQRCEKSMAAGAPGPGAYTHNATKDGPIGSPTYGFGSERQRVESPVIAGPGPGRYEDHDSDSHPKFSFGRKY